jgi:squalene synthase HpnC
MGPVLTSSDVADYPTPADSTLAPGAQKTMHGQTSATTGASAGATTGGAIQLLASPIAQYPATVQLAFTEAADAKTAQAATWQLAHTHYENFSVVSALLPRRLRQDFCNIYAFCRIADDLGDEIADRDQSMRMLGKFRQATLDLFAGRASTVVFRALESTVAKYDIPVQPFLDLIDAFEQDQRIDRYQTYEQLRDYCRRSADPVGRLVLYVGGYRDAQRQAFSDATCTALQLANFWQDVRSDILDRNRIYLPLETMEQFKVTEAQLRAGTCDENYRRCIRFEVDRTSALFDEGEALLPLLDDSVRPQVALFGQGGRAILQAIRRCDYDTLSARPVLSRWQKGRLVFRAMAGRLRQMIQHDFGSPVSLNASSPEER